MYIIYGCRQNLSIEDLSGEAVGRSFRICHANILPNYEGVGALSMRLLGDEPTDREVDYQIVGQGRFRKFIGSMGVTHVGGIVGRKIVGFVNGKIEGIVPNDIFL